MVSCNSEPPASTDVSEQEMNYELAEDVILYYSDSAQVKAKIMGDELRRHVLSQDPYDEFTKGVFVEFFDKSGALESTMEAEYAIRYEKTKEIIARDRNGVNLINVEGDTLTSSELIWDERNDRIYSNKFVKISRSDRQIWGQGFESKQDFSEGKILMIEGQMEVDNLRKDKKGKMTTVLLIILFLVLSAFFSGSEIAFISANKLGIEVRKNSGQRRGRILASFYENPRKFISTMLVGNNITLVIFTTLMTSALQPFFTHFVSGPILFLLNTIVITIIVLIFGEFLPKTFFRLYAGKVLYFLTYPLAFFKWLLTIPTWFMSGISEWIIKYVLKAPVDASYYRLSRLDLEHYIEHSVNDEDEKLEKELFVNALNLKQVKVRECMIPRTEIAEIDITESMSDLLNTFLTTNHSRIVVTDGDIDNVVGYVHHQQILKNPPYHSESYAGHSHRSGDHECSRLNERICRYRCIDCLCCG